MFKRKDDYGWIKDEDGQCWFIINDNDGEIPKVKIGDIETEKTYKNYTPTEVAIIEKNAKERQLISNALYGRRNKDLFLQNFKRDVRRTKEHKRG